MPGGREPGHVHAEFGEQQVRGGLADAGNLIQPINRPSEGGDQLGADPLAHTRPLCPNPAASSTTLPVSNPPAIGPRSTR
jgi:hypothetical protein